MTHADPVYSSPDGRLPALGLSSGCAFRCVVADPPWWPSLHANTKGRTSGPYRAGPQRYYPLLKVEQIEAMRPETEKKAHLWLWVLNQHVDWGYRVARAWGFEPQQMLTWCKPGLGTGQFQCNSESVLVCRKGGPTGNAFGKTLGTWFEWPRGRHSEKPADFFTLVERCSPGPRLEMFARTRRPGWVAWGNEINAEAA
jgi:N6-adenosine-specific RNA methylase IME4